MQAGQKEKTWDSSPFRKQHMTFWPRSHPVMFPHVQTDHWAKMKTMVPTYLASLPAALLKDKDSLDYESDQGAPNLSSSCPLPPLTRDRPETAAHDPFPSILQGVHHITFKTNSSPQNMPQYRNMYNDRARRGFRYWLIEKKTPTCNGYSFGAYKTSLGLPRV